MKSLASVALCFLTSSIAAAEIPIERNSYGTSATTRYVIGAFNMETRESNATVLTNGVGRYLFGGSQLMASAPLPSGARVEAIGIRACDTSSASAVFAYLSHCPSAGASCGFLGSVDTGNAATPGCNTFTVTLTTPFVVQNAESVLLATVITGTTVATTIETFFIDYRLQVSPPPVTATFDDVPSSHPFYQFIEALAAAGITTGCNAPPLQYCPDAPVTRGQMAVFLARALGLHFPN